MEHMCGSWGVSTIAKNEIISEFSVLSPLAFEFVNLGIIELVKNKAKLINCSRSIFLIRV